MLKSDHIQLFNKTIFEIDGSKVSIGQILLGVIIFVVGVIAIRIVMKFIDERILKKADLDLSFRHTLRSMIFYVALVLHVLFVLGVLGVPLTAFTVLGGVLAIGLGFGSQNIVNNFVSGLIVMFEKPIRINDFIEIDGITGKVDRIGPRSTTMTSTANTSLIVPNSYFLEKTIRNWTLSDEIIRASVTVGVAYGSSVKNTHDILLQIAHENPSILKHPEPFVLFQDFGDNSLDFELFFWVKAWVPMDCRRVESSIRFAIDEAFQQAGIVIAFPQRDVHLDTTKPLEVVMKSSPQ